METYPKIIGDIYPVERLETGLYSFDKSLGFRGENGIPLRSLVELYGDEHTGKSTLSWYIAARIDPEAMVWIADIEGTLDQDYARAVFANAGFTGTIRVSNYANTDKRKNLLRSHEEQLQDAVDALLDDGTVAGILDSIGAFMPIVEAGKDLGERSVGQRAKTIADASRRIAAWLRIAANPKLFFYINHTHPRIGGRGFDTPGGETKKYAANVRIWLRRLESDIPSGSGNFLAEARIQKLKQGGANADRKGLIFFIPGYGVSREMTAVMDCVDLGLAERGAVIRLGDESFGRIGALIEQAKDPEQHEVFEPFFAALKGLENE